MLQQLVMNMLAVGGENGTAADETSQDGERGFKNGQAKRNYWDGDGHDGGRFLRALQGQCAEQKADEEAAGVAEEDCGRIEIESQKAQDGSGKGNCHHSDQRRPIQQRYDECNQGRKQCGSGCQTVETINQIESVGNGEDPHDSKGESHKPGEFVVSK